MAVLTPTPKMQFESAAGVPLSGGKVYTYAAGTTTPQATFTDYTGATPNANPIILNSRGEAAIWLGSASYKFKLTDANDVEIWTVDYISAPTSGVSPILSGNVTVDSDTPGPALKVTQTGTGDALRVQDSADPDATPFRIDNNGNLFCDGAISFLPTGIICMWSGSVASIPTGWLLCNGSNGTPDLRDRFVVGAGSTYAVAATGGSADAITVSHTHTATSTVTDAGHTHGIVVPNSGYTVAAAASALGTAGSSAAGTTAKTGSTFLTTETTGVTVATSNASTGSSGTNANLPPYYALAYIMRA